MSGCALLPGHGRETSAAPAPSANGRTRVAPPLLTLAELRARLHADSEATKATVGAGREPAARRTPPAPSTARTTETSGEPSTPAPWTTPGPTNGSAATTKHSSAVASPVTARREAADDAPRSSTTARPRTGRWIKRVGRDVVVTANFSEEPLQDVLQLFSEKSGLSIIPSDEKEVQQHAITGQVLNQPWYSAFESLLDANGLRPQQDSLTGIVTVVSKRRAVDDRVTAVIHLRAASAKSIQKTLEKMVREQRTGDEKEDAQRDAVDVVESSTQADSRTLMVYTSPEKLAQVKEMVRQLDRKPPIVTISAKLIFVNRSKMEKLGFRYTITNTPTAIPAAPGQPATVGPGIAVSSTALAGQGYASPSSDNPGAFSFLKSLALSGAVNLNTFFDVTSATGLAEVETAPLISVVSDETATLAVGEQYLIPQTPSLFTAGAQQPQFSSGQYPQQTGTPTQGYPGSTQQYGQYGQNGQNGQMGQQQYGQMGGGGYNGFQTGTVLKVTPYVQPDGTVVMVIDISRDGGTLGADGRTISGPRHSFTTKVYAQDNEVLVLGGMTTVDRTQMQTGIPVLRSLPLLGALFSHSETAQVFQDLIILVQPHVVPDSGDSDPANGPVIDIAPSSVRPALRSTGGTRRP